MRIAGLALISLLCFVSMTLGADVAGTWNLEVESAQGSGAPVLVIEQDGENIKGTYAGRLGKSAFTGWVKGDKIHFEFEVNLMGNKMKAEYDGDVKSADEMSGTAKLGEMGAATWTGKRKK